MKNSHRSLILCLGSFFLLLPMASKLEAKYMPPPIHDLLAGSDLVAVGVITEVRPSTFILALGTQLTGTEQEASVEVVQFSDWACSRRWRPYEVGQRVMVFANKLVDGRYELRSAGAEGEFPMQGDLVMVQGYDLKGLPIATFDRPNSAYVVTLDTFADALHDLQRCFLVERRAKPWAMTERICSDAELEEFRARSLFHQHLADSAVRYQRR